MRYVFTEKERCLKFVSERIGRAVGDGAWYEAIGLERRGELVVAVIYTHMTEHDIVMHVAAKPGARWCSHDFLCVAFRYPFAQLGLRRVTGFVPTDNADAIKLNRHIGFTVEGVLRQGSEHGDMLVMGMLSSECRWKDYGKEKLKSPRAA